MEEVESGATLPPEARRHPWSWRQRAAVVTLFLAWVLAFASLFGAWFTIVTTGSGGMHFTDMRGYGIAGYTGADTTSGVDATVEGNYLRWPSVASVFLGIQVLTIAAVVVGLAALVVTLVTHRRPRWGRLGMLGGFAAAVLLFVAIVALVLFFPAAAHADGLLPAGPGIWGSSASPSGFVTWSPGSAWFVALSAAGVFAVSSTLSALMRRSTPSVAPAAKSS